MADSEATAKLKRLNGKWPPSRSQRSEDKEEFTLREDEMVNQENIKIVHPDCGSEPICQDRPPEWFIGKWVQKRFQVKPGPGGPAAERLWVYITHVEPHTGRLRGVVDNVPIYECGVIYGSSVSVGIEEIIGVEA